MPLARSFLYVPANREKFLEKAIGLPSDAFILDLEDSVPRAEKANARAGFSARGSSPGICRGTAVDSSRLLRLILLRGGRSTGWCQRDGDAREEAAT